MDLSESTSCAPARRQCLSSTPVGLLLLRSSPYCIAGVLLADGSQLAADLVVDCSGRQSQMPQWLAAAGLGAPRAAEVNADLGYASWWVMFCCCTDRGIWLGTLLSRVMPCLRAVVHSVASSRAQGYPLAVHSQRLFFGGSGGPLGPVSTVCHRLYPMQEAKCFFSLNGLCPCGASVEGREFGHFAATQVSSRVIIIIILVCVSSGIDPAVLTGREASGSNPTALQGMDGALKNGYHLCY
jgi:hypothetical protein